MTQNRQENIPDKKATREKEEPPWAQTRKKYAAKEKRGIVRYQE